MKTTADLIGRNISILLMFGVQCALYRKSAINFHFPRNMSVHAGAKQKAVAVKM